MQVPPRDEAPTTWPARCVSAAGPVVVSCAVAILLVLTRVHPFDLDIYMAFTSRVTSGIDELYAYLPGRELPFTYPPFAAVVFVPLTFLPTLAQHFVLTFCSTLCLYRICHLAINRVGHPGRSPLAWTWLLAEACLVTEPVVQTLLYGQVNLILVWLVFESLSTKNPVLQGLGVGLAMGFKLTPGIFLLYFIVLKQWRALAVAATTGAATGLIGLAVLPRSSWTFWTSAMWDSGRVGGLAYSSNQSINGVLWRLLGPGGSRTLWIVLSVAVLALAVFAIRRCGVSVRSIAATALVGLLVSPVSWSHHWVWLPLFVAVTCLWRPDGVRDNLALTLGASWLGAAASWIIWWMPHTENQEYLVSLPGKLLTDAYALLALATLLWLAFGKASHTHQMVGTPTT